MSTFDEARSAAEILMKHYPDQVGQNITKIALVIMGEMIYPHSYMGTENEGEMEKNLKNHIYRLLATNPSRSLFLNEAIKLPDNKIIYPAAGRWFGLGLPVYRLKRGTYIAHSMVTLVEEDLTKIQPPTAAFYIDLPKDVILVEGFDGSMLQASGILVHTVNIEKDVTIDGKVLTAGLKWRYTIVTDTSCMQWQFNRTLSQLCNIQGPGVVNNWANLESAPLSDHDHMVNTMVARIICGVCLLAAEPGRLKGAAEPVVFPSNSPRHHKDKLHYRVFTEAAWAK